MSATSFYEHDLGDGALFLEGRLPENLLLTGDHFETLWSMHPDGFQDVVIFGRPVPVPRWQQAYGHDYYFTGQVTVALDVPETLKPLFEWLREAIDARLNGLLLNWYDADRRHYIGKHRDSTVGLVEDAPIVTVSCGAARTFRLRPWRGQSCRNFAAADGTVFVMPFKTNQLWTHEVPHFAHDTGRRISITARAFVTPSTDAEK